MIDPLRLTLCSYFAVIVQLFICAFLTGILFIYLATPAIKTLLNM